MSDGGISLGKLVRRATAWSAGAAGIAAGVYLAVNVVASLLGGGLPPVAPLARAAGVLALVVFSFGFFGRLLWLSRPLLDRAFAAAGFLATFFGLAMLAVFFGSLIVDTVRWFQVTPSLIEARNRELEEQAASDYIKAGLADTYADMQRDLRLAASAEEKKEIRLFYEQEIIPEKLSVLEQNLPEIRDITRASMRQDTSAWGIFSHFLTARGGFQPQDVSIYPALLGSLWVSLITILFAVPVGVGAALYLEEYRTSGWLGRVIQVNINNLAGVPSVVYGILGAFVFVDLVFKHLESETIAARNVLGGGLTLGLLTLPLVIVAAQEAIRAVPSSIRQGAYALGATKWQVIWHQVLPLARPGILTGAILSISRAIGEAAPLVMFGAILYVQQEPTLFSRFTVLPLQIYDWASQPTQQVNGMAVEVWLYSAALASLVLLTVLLGLNAIAIILRNRAQKRARW